jgi:hypothetical protein
MRTKNECGVALISALLILVLLGILLEGFILSVNSEQELISVDRSQTQSFYGAMSGLEKLTRDLDSLITVNYKPTTSQIQELMNHPPTIPLMTYNASDGKGFYIDKKAEVIRHVPSGPYEGLIGAITPYTMTTTAQAFGSAEVRMRRELQVVLIPVFQFGIFSETDLSFFAGPNFDFGGRVHTNGNLFLAEGDSNTLSLAERVTAVGEVVRTNLSNGHPTQGGGYNGTVKLKTTGGAERALKFDEGSVLGSLGSSENPKWPDVSLSNDITKGYNGNIRNSRTGARRMDLPLVKNGAVPIDIIKRPLPSEGASNPAVLEQRNFDFASIRILLSDSANEIKSLPYVTQTEPIPLTGTLPHGEKLGRASNATYFKVPTDTDLIGGFIKIEIQTSRRVWQDVTAEILAFGVSGPELTGGRCNQYPNSIIRVQRHMDELNPLNCGTDFNKYWPNVLYDTREGALRGNIPTNQYTVFLGGVMHYVELDVGNLCNWLRTSTTGSKAIHDTGYVVYFSDRRNNKNEDGLETGEYGFEDIINTEDAIDTNGTPNGKLQDAEDVNGNDELDDYGALPKLPVDPIYAAAPLNSGARPTDTVDELVARANHAIFFRRALKLVNGASISLGSDSDNIPYGLSIAAENPIYVQGNYNENDQNFTTGNHVATSIIADAVTLLSNGWNDKYSFNCPHSTETSCNGGKSGRVAADTWYRMAVIAGKGKSFGHPGLRYQDFGTDGGVHNFLRFLERWSGKVLNYKGSIVSLYYNRQAVGTYKCGDTNFDNVYRPPTRGYKFDDEFLNPKLLPPQTPRFVDINITGFTQLKMPNQ